MVYGPLYRGCPDGGSKIHHQLWKTSYRLFCRTMLLSSSVLLSDCPYPSLQLSSFVDEVAWPALANKLGFLHLTSFPLTVWVVLVPLFQTTIQRGWNPVTPAQPHELQINVSGHLCPNLYLVHSNMHETCSYAFNGTFLGLPGIVDGKHLKYIVWFPARTWPAEIHLIENLIPDLTEWL